ncbi:hypothetical protein ACSSS7_001034 [Eimeria intestinalis]
MDHEVILKWRRSKGKYPQTWVGLKEFLGVRYGKAPEHHATEKLSTLQWKRSVDVLEGEIREAMEMCTTIFEQGIFSTFLSLLPLSLRAYWSAKKQPGDGYDTAVALCLEQESQQRDWVHRSYVRQNGARMQAETTNAVEKEGKSADARRALEDEALDPEGAEEDGDIDFPLEQWLDGLSLLTSEDNDNTAPSPLTLNAQSCSCAMWKLQQTK